MDIEVDHLPDIDDYDYLTKTKMIFLFNCLENGWKIRKKDTYYVFSKNHEGKKEILLDSYLKRFIVTNLKKD